MAIAYAAIIVKHKDGRADSTRVLEADDAIKFVTHLFEHGERIKTVTIRPCAEGEYLQRSR